MRNSQFQLVTGAAVCLLLFVFWGCDSERITAQIETICNSGETIECTCDDGSTRQKVCLDHGLGYEDCPCDDKVAQDSDTVDDTADISPADTDSQTDFGETEPQDSATDSMTDTAIRPYILKAKACALCCLSSCSSNLPTYQPVVGSKTA